MTVDTPVIGGHSVFGYAVQRVPDDVEKLAARRRLE
jgi:hypothetical protein